MFQCVPSIQSDKDPGSEPNAAQQGRTGRKSARQHRGQPGLCHGGIVLWRKPKQGKGDGNAGVAVEVGTEWSGEASL